MAPLNSENIKTFKEDISTLSQKESFDVADCDNLYGRLESIISQFETAEVDPVLNNIDVQTLKRLSTSLEHIRSRMLEADPFSYPEYTAEMRNLLNLLTQSLTVEASVPRGKPAISGTFETRSQRALAHDAEPIVIPEGTSLEEVVVILRSRAESMMEELKPAFNEYALFIEFLGGIKTLYDRRLKNTPSLGFIDFMKTQYDFEESPTNGNPKLLAVLSIDSLLQSSQSEEVFYKLLTGVSLEKVLEETNPVLLELLKKARETLGNLQTKEISTEQQLALLQHLYDCGDFNRARAICNEIFKDQISAMSDIQNPPNTSIDLTSGYPQNTYGSGETPIHMDTFGMAQYQIDKKFTRKSLQKDILDAAQKEDGGLKEDGTPYTEYDAERDANQIYYFAVYNKHNELRKKFAVETLSKKWDPRVPSVPAEKKPIWDFFKNKIGNSIPEDKNFTVNLGFEMGLEIAITAASMGGGRVAIWAGRRIGIYALRWLEKIPKLKKIFGSTSRGMRLLKSGGAHVGTRLAEAAGFETTYAALHGRFILNQKGWATDILWSAATFEVLGRMHKLVGGKFLGMKYDKTGKIIGQDPKYLARLTTKLPGIPKLVIENMIIQGSVATVTLMLLGFIRGGAQVVTTNLLNFSSWGELAQSLKYYGIDYSENALKEALRTYAVVLGLQLPGTIGAAMQKAPSSGTPMPPVKPTNRQRKAADQKAKSAETKESRKAQTEQKEVAEDGTRFERAKQSTNLGEFVDAVLGPKAKAFKNMLTKSGVNTQWLEAALMDVKGHTQRCKAIEKIFDIISAETANGKKPDPKDVLNRLKEAKDPATATALEMLFKQFGNKLRFEPAEVEQLFRNENTAYIAGDIMMRGMNTPAFATRMINHIKSLIPAAEAKLKPLFEKAERGEELTREEILTADKALNENAVVRMITYLQTSAEKFGKELMGLKASCNGVLGLMFEVPLFVTNHLVISILGLLYGKSFLKTQRDYIKAFPKAQLARDTRSIAGTGRMTDVILGTGPIEQRTATYLRSRDAALLEGVKTDYVSKTGGLTVKFYTIWVTRMLGIGDILKGAGNTFIHKLNARFIKKGKGEHEREGWQKKADKISETSNELKDAMTTYEAAQYTAPKEVLTFLTDVVAVNGKEIISKNAEIARINSEITTKNALIFAGKDPLGKLAAEVTTLTAEVAKLSGEVAKLTTNNPVIESARENLRNPDGTEKPIVTEIRDKAVEISRESDPLLRAVLYDEMVALYDRAIAEMGRGKTPAEQAMLREVIEAETEKNLRRAESALIEWTAALEDAKKSMFDTLPDPIKARAGEIFEYLAKTTIFYGWGAKYFSFKGPKTKNPPKFLKGIVDSINTMDPGLRKLLIPLVGKAVPATFTALVVLAKILALGGVVVVGGTAIGLYALSEETEAAGLKAIESDDLVEGLADLNQQDGIDLNDSLRDLDSFIALMNSGDVDEGNPVVVNFRKMTRFGGVSWIRGGRKEYYERLKAKCIDSGICTERPKSPNKTTSEKSNILSRTLNGFTLPSNAPQGLIERLKKLRTTESQANQIQDALTLYSELKTNGDPRAVKLESRLIKISNDPDKRNFKSLEKVLDEIR